MLQIERPLCRCQGQCHALVTQLAAGPHAAGVRIQHEVQRTLPHQPLVLQAQSGLLHLDVTRILFQAPVQIQLYALTAVHQRQLRAPVPGGPLQVEITAGGRCLQIPERQASLLLQRDVAAWLLLGVDRAGNRQLPAQLCHLFLGKAREVVQRQVFQHQSATETGLGRERQQLAVEPGRRPGDGALEGQQRRLLRQPTDKLAQGQSIDPGGGLQFCIAIGQFAVGQDQAFQAYAPGFPLRRFLARLRCFRRQADATHLYAPGRIKDVQLEAVYL